MTAAIRICTVLVATTVLVACAQRSKFGAPHPGGTALTVAHKAPTGRPLARPRFRYIDYYRTEVRNVSKQPLKVVWFEGFSEAGGTWYPGNILGRTLRGDEFSAWYAEGDTITHGIIPAGKTAVCDVNWNGSDSPERTRAKWAFIAVDPSGNDYYVEAVVDPSVVLRVDHSMQ